MFAPAIMLFQGEDITITSSSELSLSVISLWPQSLSALSVSVSLSGLSLASSLCV